MTDASSSYGLEPYAGLASVHRLDEALLSAHQTVRILALLTTRDDLSEGERAVIELVPVSISIAVSVRELIRLALITGARILIRPLWERTAVVDQVVNQAAGLENWRAGRRPALRYLLGSVRCGGKEDEEAIKMIVKDLHSTVHADPYACRKFLSKDHHGNLVYSAGRNLGLDDVVDEISTAAFAAVTLLEANAKRAFRVSVERWDKENSVQTPQH